MHGILGTVTLLSCMSLLAITTTIITNRNKETMLASFIFYMQIETSPLLVTFGVEGSLHQN